MSGIVGGNGSKSGVLGQTGNGWIFLHSSSFTAASSFSISNLNGYSYRDYKIAAFINTTNDDGGIYVQVYLDGARVQTGTYSTVSEGRDSNNNQYNRIDSGTRTNAFITNVDTNSNAQDTVRFNMYYSDPNAAYRHIITGYGGFQNANGRSTLMNFCFSSSESNSDPLTGLIFTRSNNLEFTGSLNLYGLSTN